MFLVISASDLPLRTIKFYSVLSGVPIDLYKRSRRLLLSRLKLDLTALDIPSNITAHPSMASVPTSYYYALVRREGALSVGFIRLSVRPSHT